MSATIHRGFHRQIKGCLVPDDGKKRIITQWNRTCVTGIEN